MTSASGASSCAALLRDVSRKLSHEVNNAANGVAVNLEVVRSRTAGADAPDPAGPFALRASEQLEALTALQEILRSFLDLAIDSLDEDRLSCKLSPAGDAVEVTFTGSVIPRGLRAERGGAASFSMRNSPHGVILSVPRNSPSSE
ncbi:MAG: hypothetical protein ACR2GJ_04455 [Gemmatimonadaceae bacterium]